MLPNACSKDPSDSKLPVVKIQLVFSNDPPWVSFCPAVKNRRSAQFECSTTKLIGGEKKKFRVDGLRAKRSMVHLVSYHLDDAVIVRAQSFALPRKE